MEELTLIARVALGFVAGLVVFGSVAWYLQRGSPDETDGRQETQRR